MNNDDALFEAGRLLMLARARDAEGPTEEEWADMTEDERRQAQADREAALEEERAA